MHMHEVPSNGAAGGGRGGGRGACACAQCSRRPGPAAPARLLGSGARGRVLGGGRAGSGQGGADPRLLGSPPCAPAVAPCTEEQYQVGPRCCPKCSPGYRVQQHCGASTDTACAPCAPGTYTAHRNGLSACLPCQDCRPALGLETRRGCSPTGDAVCGCAPGHVCVLEHGDSCAQCQPRTACRPGQSVRQRGTERQDTLCEDCPPGTFSPLDGTLEQCEPWTRCSRLQAEANPGTSSSDVTCSSWPLILLVLLLLLLLVSVLGALGVLGARWALRGRNGRPEVVDRRLRRERGPDTVRWASLACPRVPGAGLSCCPRPPPHPGPRQGLGRV
ncbi:tumor necrosis factor receptor superfamily member 14-like [Talpa occidentalis]|uniref:tumor necrosis factor receptor superfamily member 14-like n=1 Tax=Talpa occidentalis TaxID=50954 RepID=UPI0023F6D4B7|nr:tumor necrosis factor receptor superfamily member 14-like [Talpa occidentalis]